MVNDQIIVRSCQKQVKLIMFPGAHSLDTDDYFEFDFFDSNIGIQIAIGLYDLLVHSIIKTSS
jgi:hypothetical protein